MIRIEILTLFVIYKKDGYVVASIVTIYITHDFAITKIFTR
ncbi:MAG: hypothetical protein QXP05_04870 [Ignisphaera sp.]